MEAPLLHAQHDKVQCPVEKGTPQRFLYNSVPYCSGCACNASLMPLSLDQFVCARVVMMLRGGRCSVHCPVSAVVPPTRHRSVLHLPHRMCQALPATSTVFFAGRSRRRSHPPRLQPNAAGNASLPHLFRERCSAPPFEPVRDKAYTGRKTLRFGDYSMRDRKVCI